jgi:hypothetical protein
MCLVSNQSQIINPSASIGLFAKNGVLAGTSAKAMPGKFQPEDGQRTSVVQFTFNVPADPPLPAALQSMAMVQLAWDSCPDSACAKPAEQSLAMLQPIKLNGRATPAAAAAPSPVVPTSVVPTSVAPSLVDRPRHAAKPAHKKRHTTSTNAVASGTVY